MASRTASSKPGTYRTVPIVFLLFLAPPVFALSLEDISSRDAVNAMKQALSQGATKAVDHLGKPDGFWGNPQFRIPLPEGLQKAESLMRRFGKGDQVDELRLSMNRAAESAVSEAKPLLLNAVKQMTVADAKNIINGSDDSATQYFRSKTEQPLLQKFLPIVRQATAKARLSEKYDRFAGAAKRFNLIEEQDATLEQYVAHRALDGMFKMVAEEERNIRKDPLAATGALAKKVFGLIGK